MPDKPLTRRASILAKAYEQKALAVFKETAQGGDWESSRHAWLFTTAALAQDLVPGTGIGFAGSRNPEWARQPAPLALGDPVSYPAHEGGEDGTVRLYRFPQVLLLIEQGKYRDLAKSIYEALSFLWELDGLKVRSRPRVPHLLPSKEGYFFVYEERFAELLRPPQADETKFEQVIRWAEEQSGTRLGP